MKLFIATCLTLVAAGASAATVQYRILIDGVLAETYTGLGENVTHTLTVEGRVLENEVVPGTPGGFIQAAFDLDDTNNAILWEEGVGFLGAPNGLWKSTANSAFINHYPGVLTDNKTNVLSETGSIPTPLWDLQFNAVGANQWSLIASGNFKSNGNSTTIRVSSSIAVNSVATLNGAAIGGKAPDVVMGSSVQILTSGGPTARWRNQAGSGAWSNGLNWERGVSLNGPPLVDDRVEIAPTDGAARTITYDVSAPPLAGFLVDLTGPGGNRTIFNMASGTLLNTGFIVGATGRGTINQSGGSLVQSDSNYDGAVGYWAGSNGVYNLSGTGSLALAKDFYIALQNTSVGAFNQTGGAATIARHLRMAQEPGSTATLTQSGGTLSIGGDLNIGGLNLASGGSALATIDSNARTFVSGVAQVYNGGVLRLQGGDFSAAGFTFFGSGAFQWSAGVLHVASYPRSMTIPQGGALAPGRSATGAAAAGLTSISGSLAQAAGGILRFDIGGTSRGLTYDSIEITAAAQLNGPLEVAMLNGFVPTPTQTFRVLAAAHSITGSFSNVAFGQRLTTSDGIGSFQVNFVSGGGFFDDEVTLSQFQLNAKPGDFDLDGDVDGADFLRWQRGQSPNPRSATDLASWRSNYAKAVPAATPVPEPAGAALVLGVVVAFFSRRWDR